MDYFVHSNAICETDKVGCNTRIWAFSHILPGAVLGSDCNICESVFVENDVTIGNRVTIKNGVQLWDGVHVEDDVFIGPNATFTNDRFPRSKVYPEQFLSTRVCQGASIGANATILPGVTINKYAMVGAGAVVTASVPSKAVVVGNPARIVGYADTFKASPCSQTFPVDNEHNSESITCTRVAGVTLYRFPTFTDIRGSLSVCEYENNLPFKPKRFFFVYNVPSQNVRGEHCHIRCHQFLICVRGSCSVVTDDGVNREEHKLDRPDVGLFLPAKVWGTQYKYSEDAVLLVFASEKYEQDDYVRDYSKFLELVLSDNGPVKVDEGRCSK